MCKSFSWVYNQGKSSWVMSYVCIQLCFDWARIFSSVIVLILPLGETLYCSISYLGLDINRHFWVLPVVLLMNNNICWAIFASANLLKFTVLKRPRSYLYGQEVLKKKKKKLNDLEVLSESIDKDFFSFNYFITWLSIPSFLLWWFSNIEKFKEESYN